MSAENFKSPPKKLLNFFQKSRDKWKEKAQSYQKDRKLLQLRIRDLKTSRDRWKEQYQQLRADTQPQSVSENDKKRSSEDQEEASPESCAKRSEESVHTIQPGQAIEPRVQGEVQRFEPHKRELTRFGAQAHHFAAWIMLLSIDLVLQANTSLRGAEKVLQLLAEWFVLEVPSFHSIRNWMLRLGYYELTRAKAVHPDWIYIIDASISIGPVKCLVVVGVRLSELQAQGFCLSQERVTTLGLKLCRQCDGEVVFELLMEVSQKVGVPLAVVSDGAGELRRGVRQLEAAYPDQAIAWIYDITHKLACLLKAELAEDEVWKKFLNQLGLTRSRAHQTDGGFLCPPSGRAQCRYMNVHTLTEWAIRVLIFEGEADFQVMGLGFGLSETALNALHDIVPGELTEQLNGLVGQAPIAREEHFVAHLIETLGEQAFAAYGAIIVSKADLGRAKFEQLFGWLNEQSEQVAEYHLMVKLIHTIHKQIKHHGLSEHTLNQCRKHIEAFSSTERLKNFGQTVLHAVQQETDKIKHVACEPARSDSLLLALLGSSDILESLFGRWKYFVSRGAMNGITESILMLVALTSNNTVEKVKEAMEKTPMKKVKQWFKDQMGKSSWGRRREALG